MYKFWVYMLLLTALQTVHAVPESHRLYIDVFPEDANAKIFIWNIKPKFRQGIELKKGRYDVRVKAKGYHTWHKWVVVEDEDIFEQVDLIPLNQPQPEENNTQLVPNIAPPQLDEDLLDDEYILTVETIPSDAKVEFINFDRTFEQDMFLPPGEYKIRVTREGYVNQKHNINIVDDDVILKLILKPIMDSVSSLTTQTRGIPIPQKNEYVVNLDIKPAGAVVYNLTTHELYRPNMTLAPGKYVIRVQKEGYVTRRELIEVNNEDINKTIELSPPPMCFYGQSQKKLPNGDKLYYFYTVRLNFYQNFVEVHYYVQAMPSGATSHYEFKGIRRGNDLELIGLLKYNDTEEELKTHMSLVDGQLIEAINGNRQVLQAADCN